MIFEQQQIDQVKEWKKIKKPNVRLFHCPFFMSKIGGDICAKGFKRCRQSGPRWEKLCRTDPCPCQIYHWSYIMIQANRIIKYGRI
jgi:hypothetical protein